MEISAFRFYLLGGLILHKVVWEVLKRRGPRLAQKPSISFKSRVLSVIKIVILAGIIVQTLIPPVAPISSDPQTLQTAGLMIYSFGLLMAIVARVQLGRNWSDIEKSRINQDHALVAHGLYRWVRHPIYAGDLLLLLGLETALNSWGVLGVIALAIYVRQQAAKEERALSEFLPGYADYCRRTARFLPFLPG